MQKMLVLKDYIFLRFPSVGFIARAGHFSEACFTSRPQTTTDAREGSRHQETTTRDASASKADKTAVAADRITQLVEATHCGGRSRARATTI